jgi:DNA-binding SARP family transcriptional activator/WD40 repeat protein/energy-coupling factor transporter ATP-binding protein EcfA2
MAIEVLGPLTVGGRAARLGPRDRVVLAALTVRPGEPVSADRLAEALWPDQPPETWAKVVQGCIVRLRKVLGTQSIETSSLGYRLVVPADDLDKTRFERMVARGRELLTLGEPERAAYVIDEALSLWRGSPLSELDGWAPGAVERHRLEELRMDAEELSIDAALRAGRCREVLGGAEAMVSAAPLRERRWALLALAQYQSGQQAQALRTLHQVKSLLATELGLDPGPDLVALEQAILRQDPSLVAEAVLPEPSAVCPYRGLVPYDVADSETFFGRDGEVADCLRRLAQNGVVLIVGPSGSGKSSLARAGVAAALERDGQRVVVVTPGVHPLDSLTPLPTSGRVPVLVVDQCEETLTLCDDPAERVAFFARLVEHAGAGGLVLALRADRLGDLAAFPDLVRIVEPSLHLLGAMDEQSLRATVEGPARQAGLLLEPGLVDLLVREVEGEPGALPLLSHALRETWANREGRTLTVEGYRATGGIRGAVARSAEEVYERVPAERRGLLRDLLLRLVAPAAEGDPVPSRIPRRLVGGDEPHEQVITLLVDARLVTTDDGVVELAHEALVREWPRLKGWLEEDREGQRILRHLAGTADAWDSMGRPESELYRGVRLAQVTDWRERAAPDLTVVERDFLAASQGQVDAELRAARQRASHEAAARRRTRRLAAVLAAVLAVALVAAGLATAFQRDASERADEADANRLSALSRSVGSLDLSLLLAVAAVEVADTPDTRDGLLEALVEHRRALQVVQVGGHPTGSALGAHGEMLYLSSLDRTVSWRVGSDEPATRFGGWDDWFISASPTRDMVGMVGHEGNGEPFAAAFDSQGAQLTKMSLDDLGVDYLRVTAFTGDGSAMLVDALTEDGRGLRGNVVEVDLNTERVIRSVSGLLVSDGWPEGQFADDGSGIAYWNHDNPREAMLLDLTSGRSTMLRTIPRPAASAGFQPVPAGVVQRWDDGGLTLYDKSGRVAQQIDAHQDTVRDVEVAADGTWAATVDDAGTVMLWDIDGSNGRWASRESLPGHSGPVTSVEATPDGGTLLTGSEDGTVIVWDTTAEAGFGAPIQGLGERWISNRPVTVQPGRLVVAPTREAPTGGGVRAAFQDEGTVEAAFVDPTTGRVVDRVPVGQAPGSFFGSSVSLSPDRSLVAVTSAHVTVVIDVATRNVVSRIALPTYDDRPNEPVWGTEWSADGSRLLLGADGGASPTDGAIVVVDPMTGAVLERVDAGYAPQVMELSPDGQTLAAASALEGSPTDSPPTVRLHDARTLEQQRTLDLGDAGHSFDLSYSPDGRRLAVGGAHGMLTVFDTDTGRPLRPAVRVHDQFVGQVEWLPDGRTVVTTSPDGRASLYDVERGLVRTSGLPGSDSGTQGYTYLLSMGADHLTVITGGERGRRYPMGLSRWLDYACTVAGRDLTRDEWASYLPGREYRPICTERS